MSSRSFRFLEVKPSIVGLCHFSRTEFTNERHSERPAELHGLVEPTSGGLFEQQKLEDCPPYDRIPSAMNRLICLLVVCGAGNLLAQTNSASMLCQLFSTPQPQLRSLNREMSRPELAVTNDRHRLQLGSAASEDFLPGTTNSNGGNSFEVMSANDSPTGFSAFSRQMYERLDREGYFTRPELPTENRLERFARWTFEPEVFHFRKVSVTCSLLTAIKRKNPFCLISPIFLNVTW